jgi:hypothetical protein
MSWTKDENGNYSIEQSELDHIINSGCPAGCNGLGVIDTHVYRDADGDWTSKTARCQKCGILITVFND